MLQSMASGLRTARMRKVGSGDQIKTERTKKEGVRHGLESNRRKLETIQGPSQGEVGSAHRRRPRRHQWAARPARGQDSGTIRACEGQGQTECGRMVKFIDEHHVDSFDALLRGNSPDTGKTGLRCGGAIQFTPGGVVAL